MNTQDMELMIELLIQKVRDQEGRLEYEEGAIEDVRALRDRGFAEYEQLITNYKLDQQRYSFELGQAKEEINNLKRDQEELDGLIALLKSDKELLEAETKKLWRLHEQDMDTLARVQSNAGELQEEVDKLQGLLECAKEELRTANKLWSDNHLIKPPM